MELISVLETLENPHHIISEVVNDAVVHMFEKKVTKSMEGGGG